MLEKAILIAGPTASGKSRLAIEVARATGGTIVNADSMQVYSLPRILTARPDAADLARAPHLLYGHVGPAETYSTGRWLREVEELTRQGTFASSRPIFVGGTGLYFKALLEGLSPMPAIPAPVREAWRARLDAEGAEALHRTLAERDPQAAAIIRTGDGQRIVRALEVMDVSGRSITAWQARRGHGQLDPSSTRRLVIEPPRQELGARIDTRFDRMIDEGALEEVKALIRLGIGPAMPVMKAIGVRELAAALAGETSLELAIERAKSATRRYAKRQSTWFRTQFDDGWEKISEPEKFDIGIFDRPD
jgi:tRNA dimethylallyltransferase